MFKLLNKLQQYLFRNNLLKEAMEVKELEKYEEPWHEEAAKEFGEEPISEEEYLKNILPDYKFESRKLNTSWEDLDKILEKENFIPASSAEKHIHAGSGAFGDVIRGIYNGKSAVAKVIITYSGEFDKELKNWRNIIEASKKLPSKLKKHIPEIYHLNKGYIVDEQNYPTKYEIIVMEELFPISSNVSEIILRNLNSLRDKAKNLWKDEDFIYEMSDSIKELLDSDFDNYKLSIRDIFKILINARISPQNNFLSLSVFSNSLSKEIINFIKSKLTEDELKDSYINMDLMEIEAAIEKLINYSFSKAVWPYKFEDYQKEKPLVYKYIPEISGIFKLLLELADREIKWADLHDKNLMQDSQGTLKIIDVGLYSTESFENNNQTISSTESESS